VAGIYDGTKSFMVDWTDVARVKAEYSFSISANKLADLYTDEMYKKGICMHFTTDMDGPVHGETVARPIEPIDPHLL
jgi:hypothetical protein